MVLGSPCSIAVAWKRYCSTWYRYGGTWRPLIVPSPSKLPSGDWAPVGWWTSSWSSSRREGETKRSYWPGQDKKWGSSLQLEAGDG